MDGIGRGLVLPSSREAQNLERLGDNKKLIKHLLLAFVFPKTQYGLKTQDEKNWTRKQAIQAMLKEQKVAENSEFWKLDFRGKEGPIETISFWEFPQRYKFPGMKDKSIEVLKKWESKTDHGGKWFWARWLLYRVEKKPLKPKPKPKPKQKTKKGQGKGSQT